MRIRPLRRTFCADRRSEAVLDTLRVTGWDGIIKLNEAEVGEFFRRKKIRLALLAQFLKSW